MRYINAHPGSSLYMHIILFHFKANMFYFIFYILFNILSYFLTFFLIVGICCNTCLVVTYFILLLIVHCVAPKYYNKFLVRVNLLGNKTWFWFWFWFWFFYSDLKLICSDCTSAHKKPQLFLHLFLFLNVALKAVQHIWWSWCTCMILAIFGLYPHGWMHLL